MAYSSKTTVSTKYRVSGGNSVISTTFSSPFEAIGRAFKVGGKVTETDSGVTIFESNTTKYYLFQFTNFYGSTQAEQKQIVGLMIMQMLMLFMAGQESYTAVTPRC